jgi:hypothetical protein
MTWLIMTLNLVQVMNAMYVFSSKKFSHSHYFFFKFCIYLAFLSKLNGLNLGNPERKQNVQVFAVSVMP